METRSSDSCLDILIESPANQHLKINGSKLPTFNQVLLCYLAKLKELREHDASKTQKLTLTAAQYVVGEIIAHYQKAHSPHISEIKIAQKVIKFHDEDMRFYTRFAHNISQFIA